MQGKKEPIIKREKKPSRFFKKPSSYQINRFCQIHSEILCDCHTPHQPAQAESVFTSCRKLSSAPIAHADIAVPRSWKWKPCLSVLWALVPASVRRQPRTAPGVQLNPHSLSQLRDRHCSLRGQMSRGSAGCFSKGKDNSCLWGLIVENQPWDAIAHSKAVREAAPSVQSYLSATTCPWIIPWGFGCQTCSYLARVSTF